MTETRGTGWRFLHSYRWIGYFAMLVVFALACVWLSHWQFDRLEEKRAEIARIDRNYDAAPVPLDEAVPDRLSFDEDAWKWHPVELHGTYLGGPVLARNRPGPEGVGSDLIQAFQLDNGNVLFIDRGWVPIAGTDAIPSDLPQAGPGEATVQVRLRASERQITGRTATGDTVPSINGEMLSALTGTAHKSYQAVYGQLISESPAAPTGLLPAPPERDEGPHLSYALQWAVFILIAGIGVAYAARQEFRNLNAGDARVEAEDQRRAERKRRRGPTDADIEDALLDD